MGDGSLLFNSFTFLIFFVIVYVIYRSTRFSTQNWLLLVASYVFYGWWDVRFLFLIAFSTTVDFWIGLLLAEGRLPRRERITASLFLIGAAAIFLNIDWQSISAGQIASILAPTTLGVLTLIGTISVVIFANSIHKYVILLEWDRRRKVLLFISVAVNLGFLGAFKYFNFFADSARVAIESVGWNADRFHLNIILPVGISFYTFQSLSYTLDIGRGRMMAAQKFWDFALFVSFFPPLVAGPIERARHLLPQLQRPRTIRLNQSVCGLQLILMGLVKKVAIADGLAVSVDSVYNSTGAVSGTDIALTTVLFAFQIFCDFSGYTDIARGIAKLLGIELAINFNLPYFSRNPSEFWRRWHISLSSWLRDYLYIPLGGNRKGNRRTYINLMATMTLGGLWHGAAANFILWGMYQGALLCGHRALTGREEKLPAGVKLEGGAPPYARPGLQRISVDLIKIIFFFLFICYGWLLFRANSFDQILRFTMSLAGFGPSVSSVMVKPPLAAVAGLTILIALQFIEWLDGRGDTFRHWPRPIQGSLYAACLFILAMGTSNAPAQFIYFQF